MGSLQACELKKPLFKISTQTNIFHYSNKDKIVYLKAYRQEWSTVEYTLCEILQLWYSKHNAEPFYTCRMYFGFSLTLIAILITCSLILWMLLWIRGISLSKRFDVGQKNKTNSRNHLQFSHSGYQITVASPSLQKAVLQQLLRIKWWGQVLEKGWQATVNIATALLLFGKNITELSRRFLCRDD